MLVGSSRLCVPVRGQARNTAPADCLCVLFACDMRYCVVLCVRCGVRACMHVWSLRRERECERLRAVFARRECLCLCWLSRLSQTTIIYDRPPRAAVAADVLLRAYDLVTLVTLQQRCAWIWLSAWVVCLLVSKRRKTHEVLICDANTPT